MKAIKCHVLFSPHDRIVALLVDTNSFDKMMHNITLKNYSYANTPEAHAPLPHGWPSPFPHAIFHSVLRKRSSTF